MLTEPQIEAVLDRAGIGHQRGESIARRPWWTTMGSVHIVPVARAFEREVRAEAAQVIQQALQALDGPSHSWEENQAEAARILGAWLNKEQTNAGQ